MIDAACGGALVDKTSEAARNLIANMAANSQQFGTRLDLPSKNVNEINISSLEQQIASLTSLVRQMVVGNTQMVKACGICSVVGHPTNMCPTLQEEPTEQVKAAGGFPRQLQRKYDPCSNTYNLGWRDNPKLSYGNPQTLADSRKDEQNKDLYETFRRCEKLKLKGCEKVRIEENVSVVIQRKFHSKCKDPGMFTIPCTLGNTRFEKAMIDLGASIIVTPYSIYASLKLGPLNKIGVVIQLADKSNAYPKSVVEDVLVQVNDLILTTDFYVFDMENETAPILLGRPFLKTSKTKIDVHSGTLTVEFDGKIVKFHIYDAMKYPSDDNPIYSIDVIDSFA
ncbi:uncharacterized protein [Aristolochia californica]|uniref:uncharacterized protein n=1 Tax=Aristolochia californica TaxID=171875 RepID=UPI0035D6C959